jgi:hypothetical protein
MILPENRSSYDHIGCLCLISDIYTNINRDDLAYRYLKEHTLLRTVSAMMKFLKQVTGLENPV